MIRKLKRRYFISNMALLSATLVVGLSVLFGIIYQSEVKSSYSVMNNLLEKSDSPEKRQEAAIEPTAFEFGTPEQNSGYDFGYPPFVPWVTTAAETTQAAVQSTVTTFETKAAETSAEAVTEIQPAETTAETSLQSETTAAELTTTALMPFWQTPADIWNRGWTAPQGWPYMAPTWMYGWGIPESYWQGNWGGENQFWNQNPNGDHQPQETALAVTSVPPAVTDLSATTETSSTDLLAERGMQPIITDTESTAATTISSVLFTTMTSAKPLTEVIRTKNNDDCAYVPDAVIAHLDEAGNIQSFEANDAQSDVPDTLNTVNQAMDVIKKNGSHSGTLQVNDTPYRFLYQPDENGTSRLVLLNRTLELSTLSRLLFLFLLLLVIGLLVMFAVSELLANWTVKPIAAAWEKQKQFVADASHELKTPLAVISANTEVILANRNASVTGQSKWLHYIQSETSRMSKLITNLLSIARMDHSSETETGELLHCSEIVSNVCLVFEPIIFENGKTLNTIIQRNITMHGDEDNLKQLLSILLDNAVLHSVPNAQITVGLSKDAQGKIRIAVSNTANDIPQEQLAHLFDRFYRLDKEGSPNGSGLGLSIAKSIVQQIGGTLSVSCENHVITFVAVF